MTPWVAGTVERGLLEACPCGSVYWTMARQTYRGGLYRHLVRSLSCDKYIPSSKTICALSAICSFLFQFPVSSVSLRSPSSCLRLFPRLLHSTFPSVTWFRRQFLRQMWSVLLAFILLYAVCFLCKIHPLGRRGETCRHNLLLVYVFCMPLPTADLVHVKYLLEKVNSM